jgi:geranylgeranylglycerol-phosphate geranylgeranyltransferase
MKTWLIPVFQLIRLHNALSAFLCVLLGAHLSGHLAVGPPLTRALIASTVGLLVIAGANAINDYYDIEIDRVNKPSRPLPSGKISPGTARLLAFLLFGLALALATVLGPFPFLIALILTVMSYLYAVYLKRTLMANPLVGLVSSMWVIYGSVTLDTPLPAVLPAMLIFLFITSREILKVVEDYEGDALAKARTIATVFGPTTALRCYYLTSLIVILTSFVPYIVGQFGAWYLFTILTGVDLIIIATMIIIIRQPTRSSIRRALSFTKVSFFTGLLAMFLQ